MSKDYPWGKGTSVWLRDTTANDSDKVVYTCPVGKIAVIDFVAAALKTTATAGNRYLVVGFYNSTPAILFIPRNRITIPASQTGVVLVSSVSPTFTTNNGSVVDFTSSTVGDTPNVISTGPMPPMVLTAGMYLRAYDTAAVDAAADDLTVIVHYVEYDA